MRREWVLGIVVAVGCSRPSGAGSEGTETSTESSETDESGEPSETSTAGFAPPAPDLPESCDPFMQDCPDGEKCVPYASSGGAGLDANKCVPVLGEHTTGEPCTYGGWAEATDDCDAGSVCWNVIEVDGELLGTCQPFCSGNADNPSCPEGWYCQLYGNGAKTICEVLCDPLAQDCADGLGCYWAGNAFWCAHSSENIAAGEPCGGHIHECAPGLVCVNARAVPDC